MPRSPKSVTDRATWAGTASSGSPSRAVWLEVRASSAGRAPGRAKSTASLGLALSSGAAAAGGQEGGSARAGGRRGRGTAGGVSSGWNRQGPGSEHGRPSAPSSGSASLPAVPSSLSGSAGENKAEARPATPTPGPPGTTATPAEGRLLNTPALLSGCKLCEPSGAHGRSSPSAFT